ncbi:hypothetical protein WJX73_004897 [Symbiochloris irregularis]|uniref:Cyanovirin-N domain-containing protein n=1 Tax=Symbiochloris irregularis TaxID=706552 RepID=A0AAW1P448_9CHLO
MRLATPSILFALLLATSTAGVEARIFKDLPANYTAQGRLLQDTAAITKPCGVHGCYVNFGPPGLYLCHCPLNPSQNPDNMPGPKPNGTNTG